MASVFVYGTLKKGKKNHSVMLDAKAVFVREEIANGYVMYDTGYGYPTVVRVNGDDDMAVGIDITGEIYNIPDQQIAMIDSFEGLGKLYDKEHIPNLEEVWIYIWHGSIEGIKKIPNGTW